MQINQLNCLLNLAWLCVWGVGVGGVCLFDQVCVLILCLRILRVLLLLLWLLLFCLTGPKLLRETHTSEGHMKIPEKYPLS